MRQYVNSAILRLDKRGVLGNQRRAASGATISWATLLERTGSDRKADRPSWTPEWKELGLGCELVDPAQGTNMTNLFFVQMGFGVDQHGDSNATKAAVRAVRNAIEFNSIPGVIESIPGGRKQMLIHVKLGIPPDSAKETSEADGPNRNFPFDPLEVAKVFPYGRLLPVEAVVGGLSFSTGRLVPELGDIDDEAICVAACVSIGYDSSTEDDKQDTRPGQPSHTIYSTKDGL